MIKITEITKIDNAKLLQVHATLVSMSQQRHSAKKNLKKRHKKLKLDLSKSENGHFNNLLSAVKAEIEKRGIKNG